MRNRGSINEKGRHLKEVNTFVLDIVAVDSREEE